MPLIIAIDGPAGSGKSTVARALAAHLGLPHFDTGAVYRTVAKRALDSGVDLDDESALKVLAESMSLDLSSGTITIDSHKPGQEIRTREVGIAASRISVHPMLRKALVIKQRAALERSGGVAEGRDIGTVVAPMASLKIFMVASPLERARRRLADHASAGEEGTLEALAAEIAARDDRDATRAASPLQPAGDSIQVDTTDREPKDVVAEVLGLLSSRGISQVRGNE